MMAKLIWLILVSWHFIGQGNFVNTKIKMQKTKLQLRIQEFLIVMLLAISYWLFSISSVYAASLYFKVDSQEVVVGEDFIINLMLDAEGEQLNAVEGKIYLSDNLLLSSINDGGSLVGLWVESPKFVDGGIVFSGIIPGGYRGILGPHWSGYVPSNVLQLSLRAKKTGVVRIRINNSKVLLHDGIGTEADLKVSNIKIAISPRIEGMQSRTERARDNILPEIFTPEITKDSNIFAGKWFLVFVAKDKGSGVSYYEVKEGREGFVKTKNPYLLKDQSLTKNITVKAVDRDGNARIVKMLATNPIPWYRNYLAPVMITVVLIYILWNKIKRHFFKIINFYF